MASNPTNKSMILHLVLRIILYSILMVVLTMLMFHDAEQQGQQFKFMEATFTEWTQQIILLIMILLFAYCAQRYREMRCLSIVLGGIAAAGLVREYNNFFNNHVFNGAWQILAMIVIIITGWLVWRHRQSFWSDLHNFQNTTSYGLLLAGFLTTFVFSRLFGQTAFWETLMEERYFRSVKNAAEESVELLGYGLLLAAAIEFFMLVKSIDSKNTELA